MMTPFRFLASMIVVLSLTSLASAQTGGTTGTSGSTGGTSTTGQTSTGSSATGSSGTGATGNSGSGLSGQSSFGGQVPGESTTKSNASQTFIGTNATEAFVGGAATEAANQQGASRQFQAIQNNQSQQSTTQQTGTPREIRTALRVGFSFPTASQSQMTGRLAHANVASLSRFSVVRPELTGIEVALNSNGTVVLTGSAASVETKRLAANLMRLQPGIRKVDNQIVVQAN